jgi:hypothetical protein
MATGKKFITKEMVQIIVAIIAALSTIGVAYFQFVWKPSQSSDKVIMTQYSGRILDAISQRPIVNAKVTIEIPV